VWGLNATDGTVKWRHNLGSGVERWIYSAPAVYYGRFYAGTRNHLARIEAPSGKIEWEKSLEESADRYGPDWMCTYSSAAVSGKYVIVGGFWTKGDNIIAVRTDTGEKVWGHPADKGTQASAAFSGDGKKVLFVSKISKLYCCGADDGKEDWSVKIGEGCSATTPAVKDDIVVAGDGAGTMTGSVRFHRRRSRVTRYFSAAATVRCTAWICGAARSCGRMISGCRC
jgi:outer membrane protein assembly factor BamB